jgi:hypothetical protein
LSKFCTIWLEHRVGDLEVAIARIVELARPGQRDPRLRLAGGEFDLLREEAHQAGRGLVILCEREVPAIAGEHSAAPAVAASAAHAITDFLIMSPLGSSAHRSIIASSAVHKKGVKW